MIHKGIPKLIEECSELSTILAKKLACMNSVVYFDGTLLQPRIEEEMGDVMASIQFVCDAMKLDMSTILARADIKRELYKTWTANGS